jgi:hypothetical protein
VRDVRGPVWSPPPRLRPPEGGYALRVRRDGAWWAATQSTDPASCIGWEGSVYPVAFAWEAPLLRARRGEVVPLFEGATACVSSWVAEGEGLDDGADRAVLVVGSDGEPALWLLPAGCAASAPERPGDMLVALRTRDQLALTADGAVLAGR